MTVWTRWRADLARPEAPTPRGELTFHLLAPAAILAIAQATDPGTIADVVALVPVLVAFALRPLVPRLPAELFAVLVVVPVTLVVGRDGDLEGAFFLTVVMVLYTAWSLGSVTRAVLIAAFAAAGPLLVATQLVPDSGIGWNAWAMAHVFTFVLGRTLHRQRLLIAQLEAARQALAVQAVAEERRRIARELHDLAGHTLAAMALHVTGARHVLRRDPDEAERALRDAESVGRSSLDQIRATVTALRADERGTDPALAGSADLPELVEEYRSAGLAVTFDRGAGTADIEGPVGVALHRIVREALANVARHAPGNEVRVELRSDGDAIVVTVVDRGRPPDAPSATEVHFGILGMTERARALGGDLVAGATADGWSVRAHLPAGTAHPSRQDSSRPEPSHLDPSRPEPSHP